MSKRNNGIGLAFMVLAMVVISGCHEQPQQSQQPSEPITKEQSDMRTAVPLVRRLDPDETGTIELEFEVPAQADDAAPPVFIGVRLTGIDPTAVANAAADLRQANISAEVHLYRIQESGATIVRLERSRWVSRSEVESVTLAKDGFVPGLSAINADFSTMQKAGLLAEGVVYRELDFAYTPNLPVGRYRVAIRFVQNREALFAADAEFLVAYTAKGK